MTFFLTFAFLVMPMLASGENQPQMISAYMSIHIRHIGLPRPTS